MDYNIEHYCIIKVNKTALVIFKEKSTMLQEIYVINLFKGGTRISHHKKVPTIVQRGWLKSENI